MTSDCDDARRHGLLIPVGLVVLYQWPAHAIALGTGTTLVQLRSYPYQRMGPDSIHDTCLLEHVNTSLSLLPMLCIGHFDYLRCLYPGTALGLIASCLY